VLPRGRASGSEVVLLRHWLLLMSLKDMRFVLAEDAEPRGEEAKRDALIEDVKSYKSINNIKY
jgi:hypothetical protein